LLIDYVPLCVAFTFQLLALSLDFFNLSCNTLHVAKDLTFAIMFKNVKLTAILVRPNACCTISAIWSLKLLPFHKSPLPLHQSRSSITELHSSVTKMPSCIRQETSPISQDQLAAEVKGIYGDIFMVGANGFNFYHPQAADPGRTLGPEQWRAATAHHRPFPDGCSSHGCLHVLDGCPYGRFPNNRIGVCLGSFQHSLLPDDSPFEKSFPDSHQRVLPSNDVYGDAFAPEGRHTGFVDAHIPPNRLAVQLTGDQCFRPRHEQQLADIQESDVNPLDPISTERFLPKLCSSLNLRGDQDFGFPSDEDFTEHFLPTQIAGQDSHPETACTPLPVGTRTNLFPHEPTESQISHRATLPVARLVDALQASFSDQMQPGEGVSNYVADGFLPQFSPCSETQHETRTLLESPNSDFAADDTLFESGVCKLSCSVCASVYGD
jgi:hypothetical protein